MSDPSIALPCTSPTPFGRFSWRCGVAIFVAACLTRATVGIWTNQQSRWSALQFPDEQQYWSMASSLAKGEGLRDELGFTATRMPLYPAMLSMFAPMAHGVAVAKVVHWLMGAVGAVLTGWLAWQLFRDARIAWAAALMVVVDPFLVAFSSLLLTETPYTTLQLVLWIVMVWATRASMRGAGGSASWCWVLVGAAGAACVYVRESAILTVMGLVAAQALVLQRRSVMAGALLAIGVLGVCLSAWAVRNRIEIGQLRFLTTRGGISLYDGVHAGANGASDLGTIKQMPAVAGLDEVAWDAYFRAEALRAIQADPLRILKLAVIKLARTWNPAPNTGSFPAVIRAAFAGWSVAIYILAVAGFWILLRHSSGQAAFLLAWPAICTVLLHSLFVGSVRYRLPAMPMLEIAAATAIVGAFRWWGERGSNHDDR